MPIDIKRLENLMAKMQSLGIAELAYEGKGEAIRLVADARSGTMGVGADSPDMAEPLKECRDIAAPRFIHSSMHGVFYRSDAPHAPPLVDAGSLVKAGDPLCVVEAMKMLSKIEAEYAFRVMRVLMKDGDVVSPGVALFEVEPIDA